MSTKQVRFGGIFAPPFTDELLEAYRKMFAKLPTSPVKDALAYVCLSSEKWWELPEPSSTKNGRAHPVRPDLLIVDLNPEHKEILDPLIPWPHELDSIGGDPTRKGLFDQIEIDAALRNAPKCRAWIDRVYDAVIRKHFPSAPERYAELWAAYHAKEKWFALVSPAERKRFDADMEEANACSEAIIAAVSAKNHPDVPRPDLEPTPLRNAACHVLWHTRELDLGREPLTSDKLLKL